MQLLGLSWPNVLEGNYEPKFERIEKHLYRRQYQTADGDWVTVYYAGFVDWKGKRRIFPVGSDLKTARDELKVYGARNIRRGDFDADRQKPEPPVERLTLARYILAFLRNQKSVAVSRFLQAVLFSS